jgi:uncharacterized protein YjeT (DUF2065 family)
LLKKDRGIILILTGMQLFQFPGSWTKAVEKFLKIH